MNNANLHKHIERWISRLSLVRTMSVYISTDFAASPTVHLVWFIFTILYLVCAYEVGILNIIFWRLINQILPCIALSVDKQSFRQSLEDGWVVLALWCRGTSWSITPSSFTLYILMRRDFPSSSVSIISYYSHSVFIWLFMGSLFFLLFVSLLFKIESSWCIICFGAVRI